MTSSDDRSIVAIGRIGRARGVRGEVFLQPWTDDPDERFAVGTVLRTDPDARGPLTVATLSTAGGKVVVRFEGIDDRGQAETLRGLAAHLRARWNTPRSCRPCWLGFSSMPAGPIVVR